MQFNNKKLQKLLGKDLPYKDEANNWYIPSNWMRSKYLRGWKLFYVIGQVVNYPFPRKISRTTLWRWEKDFKKLDILLED